MVVEVLDGALAGDNGLDEETEHGEHGKTAVLDLLDLQKTYVSNFLTSNMSRAVNGVSTCQELVCSSENLWIVLNYCQT